MLWRKMVSTRGPKFKFSEGEKVLCYEPDPTKAKVLYDSKVLEVKVSKDQRGRKAVEFLIHFQGWNSSWDRCVTEDYVLKDTEENRQLQKDLAHKAQLQLCSNYRRGAYLYRRDRTKHRKLSDRINDSLERQKVRRRVSTSASATSNSNASNASRTSVSVDSEQDSSSQEDDDEEGEDGSPWGQNSSDESSEMEDEAASEDAVEERIPLTISSGLKQLLEHDYNLITNHNKLLVLPAEPNVVSILEGFVKHCAVNQLCNSHTTSGSAKNGHNHRHSYKYLHSKTRDVDSICRNLNICKEVADGLRVYFDFTLGQLLLYAQEQEQYCLFEKGLCSRISVVNIKKETETKMGDNNTTSDACKSEPTSVIEDEHESDCVQEREKDLSGRRASLLEDTNLSPGDPNTKRSLRSSHRMVSDNSQVPGSSNGVAVADTVNAQSHMSSVASNSSHCSTSSPAVPNTPGAVAREQITPNVTSPRSKAVLSQVMNWHLVPQSLYNELPGPPSLTYGATHLARLFVRLPDLVYTGTMPSKKLKLLTSHLETFMAYLEEHTEWFADHNFRDNQNELTNT